MKAVVLLSGGIDSMACAHFYLSQGYNVEGVFCNYGQPASSEELSAAEAISNYLKIPLHVIKLEGVRIPPNGEICARNALLVFQAMCYAGFGMYKIILGIHDGTKYSDCTEQFVIAMNKIIDCYSNGITILEAPFVKWLKPEIIEYCKTHNLPISLTYSCETGSNPPCGLCDSCLDRKEFLNEGF